MPLSIPYRIRLFAGARDLAGCDEVIVTGRSGATVGELKALLRSQWPALQGLPPFRLAVDQQFADDAQTLQGTEEIACIPPVSGG